MRRLLPFGIFAAVFLFLALPLQAQDVSGTWDITTTTQRGERTITVTLVQDGATVTGTAMMPMMGRPGGGGGNQAPMEVAISDGKFENGTLTFSITMGMGERSFTQTYTATSVTATTMEGTVTGGMRATDPIPFKGAKKEG
jgi:uncharacterized protein YfiM (DUF2279 family)